MTLSLLKSMFPDDRAYIEALYVQGWPMPRIMRHLVYHRDNP